MSLYNGLVLGVMEQRLLDITVAKRAVYVIGIRGSCEDYSLVYIYNSMFEYGYGHCCKEDEVLALRSN